MSVYSYDFFYKHDWTQELINEYFKKINFIYDDYDRIASDEKIEYKHNKIKINDKSRMLYMMSGSDPILYRLYIY